MKKVTVGDILEAMEKNGYKVNRDGEFFNYSEDGSVAACAMGQAAINLGVDADGLFSFFNRIKDENGAYIYINNSYPPGSWVADTNDNTKQSPKTIAKKLRMFLGTESVLAQSEEIEEVIFKIS